MKEISVTGSGLSAMCRLCLSSGVTLLDIFWYSSKMKKSVAGVIMKCAGVQITRGDEMPNFICQSCYTQLEKTRQFLIQIKQSDITLRHYLQLIYASDKPIKAEDIVKCESLELNDVFEMELDWKETEPANFNQENKKEMCLKSDSKVDIVDEYLFSPTECAAATEDILSNIDGQQSSCEDSKIDIVETKVSEDMTVSWKEKEPKNYNATNKLMDEISLKSEIKDEKMVDNLLILTESVDDTENTSSNGDIYEINCEDTIINIGHASKNSCLRSANVTKHFRKCKETIKRTMKNNSTNCKKHKKSNKLKSYQCDICSKCFARKFNLNQHKLIHTGEQPYQCDLCNKCFSQSSDLNRHKRTHTGEKPFKCDICKKYFTQLSSLNFHKLKHTGEKPYQCDLCNKRCYKSSELIRHKRYHTGERPYQCDLCKKRFYTSCNLNTHKRTHTGEKPHQCDVCGKCLSQSHLNEHKLKHTGEKPYQCGLCNKYFSYLGNFKAHKRTHTGEKPFKCDLCNMCFSQSSTLSSHKLTHTGEKPYKCDLCNNCFSKLSDMYRHKRTHSGERPYQCDLCKKCYSRSSHLKDHKRIHTGGKPYQCDVCNMCFSESSSLNRHKRIHTGGKPYQCDVCNMCFSESSSLNRHKRIHTDGKPYQCDVCNKFFTQLSKFNKHKFAHS